MKYYTLIIILVISTVAPVAAGQESAAARAFAQERAGSRLGPEALEALTARLGRLAAREGDKVFDLMRRTGRRSLRLLEEVGDSPAALRLLARHGDEAAAVIRRPAAFRLVEELGDPAATVLVRHPAAGEAVLTGHGAEALPALTSLTGRQARRLALMTEDGSLRGLGRTDEVLRLLGRLGDGAMDFVWRHKGALAVTAALSAFLEEPEAFIHGTRDLAEVAVEPASRAAEEVAKASGSGVAWILASTCGLLMILVWRHLRRTAANPG